MKKYRVYEIKNNKEDNIKEHGHFGKLKDAQRYAESRYYYCQASTFVINYSNEKNEVFEQYYGKYSN
jgi:hypothetical protein